MDRPKTEPDRRKGRAILAWKRPSALVLFEFAIAALTLLAFLVAVSNHVAERLALGAFVAVIVMFLGERLLRQLGNERDRSKAILESIADAVITTDGECCIRSVNPAAERLAGRAAKQLAGLPLVEALPLYDPSGREVPAGRRLLPRAIGSLSVTATQDYELMLGRPGGERVPVSIVAAPTLDHRGRLLGGVQVMRDVSREREIDQMKSSLVSTVSHELRTPLTMILGFSELLVSRDLGEERSREALTQIHDSADRLSRLIDDLLSVSRIESGHVVPRPAVFELEAAVERVLRPIANGRDVRVSLGTDLPLVLADPDMLTQILTNLVSNAMKYSPPDAEVSVSARRDTDHVEVAVRDRGIGLAGDEAARVFEKFFRADRPEVQQTGGTGLGLYITRELVERQGGRIWVESEPGVGSAFVFSIPLAPELAVKEAS